MDAAQRHPPVGAAGAEGLAEVREPRRGEPGLALAELVLEGRDEAQGLEPVQVRRVLQQEQLPLRAPPRRTLQLRRGSCCESGNCNTTL